MQTYVSCQKKFYICKSFFHFSLLSNQDSVDTVTTSKVLCNMYVYFTVSHLFSSYRYVEKDSVVTVLFICAALSVIKERADKVAELSQL